MPVDEKRLKEVCDRIDTADRRDDNLGLYMVLLQANRQAWPDAWLEKAERTHSALIQTRYEESQARQRLSDAVPGSPEESEARAALEAASRRNRTATRSWRWARQPQRAVRRRVPSKVRREVIAEWEETGRVCGICRQPVAPEEAIHVYHDAPTALDGTSDKENLRVGHARCNSELGDGTILHTRALERSRARKATELGRSEGQ
jgi:HNH endonuclease